MRDRPTLELADARIMMAAAREEAGRRRLEVSIAVVDEAGVPILLERLDGARLHTPEAAILKARTAAITRGDTAELEQLARDNPGTLLFPGRLPLTGGMPIAAKGAVVGGIGSSGASPEGDRAVCHAGLDALKQISRLLELGPDAAARPEGSAPGAAS
ncbi:GlcG/HbpS family heme-binding protein [Rhizosaccharibacter radicis]|uniref:Heme-binding protein n=1 Tax=Rhizosaccharibacter radicis TaxID=2782605 RepID=A0ABT1VYJ2_9PROT|nr:heme-binding protein [Acetobacteraceae bacterium KSS12]